MQLSANDRQLIEQDKIKSDGKSVDESSENLPEKTPHVLLASPIKPKSRDAYSTANERSRMFKMEN